MTVRNRIDVHNHIMPNHYVETVGAEAIGSQGSSGRVPAWSVEAALEGMDAAGISVAVTSVSSPGFRGLTSEKAVALARWCNDFAAKLMAEYPDRFGMFAALPLSDMDACLTEVDRAYDDLGADGVCLLTNYDGRYLGDKGFEPLYQELARRNSVIFVHPTAPVHPVKINRLSDSTLEFPFDTTRTVASLIFGGVLARYPTIRWIMSHAGGAIPYLSGRVEVLTTNNPALREFIPNGFSAELGKLYFDCALSANPVMFEAMSREVSVDRIVFGTDFPFGPKGQMQLAAAGLEAMAWNARDKQKIQYSNARMLFPRFAR